MPVLIPIVAAAASYFGAAAAVVGLVGLQAVVVGAVVGAVIGAAVGAIGAAVTGGDIGKGALYGAIGGAVAGGFAGYFAGAAKTAATGASSVSANENVVSAVAAEKAATVGKGGGSLLSISGGKDSLAGAALTTGGQMVTGYAQGEAAGKVNEDNLAAAEKSRAEEFDRSIVLLQQKHADNMAEISTQGGTQAGIAAAQNESQMALLNTRIGADKDTVATAGQREDDKLQAFNDSITNTDSNLFERPTLDFGGDNFSQDFDQGGPQVQTGSSAKTGGVVQGPLSPAEIAARRKLGLLEEAKKAVA